MKAYLTNKIPEIRRLAKRLANAGEKETLVELEKELKRIIKESKATQASLKQNQKIVEAQITAAIEGCTLSSTQVINIMRKEIALQLFLKQLIEYRDLLESIIKSK